MLPDCDKCGNTRVVKKDNEYVRCSCVEQSEVKEYLARIGRIQLPDDWIKEKTKNFQVQTHHNITVPQMPLKKYNGVIAHLIMKAYPESYDCYNLYELYEKMKDNDNFSQIYSLNKPYLVLTGGLPEEHQAVSEESWTETVYGRAGKQIFGQRIKRGLYTWYISMGDPYSNLDKFLKDNKIEKQRLTKTTDRANFNSI